MDSSTSTTLYRLILYISQIIKKTILSYITNNITLHKINIIVTGLQPKPAYSYKPTYLNNITKLIANYIKLAVQNLHTQHLQNANSKFTFLRRDPITQRSSTLHFKHTYSRQLTTYAYIYNHCHKQQHITAPTKSKNLILKLNSPNTNTLNTLKHTLKVKHISSNHINTVTATQAPGKNTN